MTILCGSPLAPFTSRKPSAPAPPPLLTTTMGCFMRLCFAITDWMKRAIWSAPPPVPAGTMNSTVLVGSQAWAWGAAARARAAPMARPCSSVLFMFLAPRGSTVSCGCRWDFMTSRAFARRRPPVPGGQKQVYSALRSRLAALGPPAEIFADRHHQDRAGDGRGVLGVFGEVVRE